MLCNVTYIRSLCLVILHFMNRHIYYSNLQGDSGSPAQLQMVDGRWVQVGVLAFGALYGCEVGYPSGNVLLPVYVDWIEFVTGVDFDEYNR